MKNGLKLVLLAAFLIGGSTLMGQQVKLGYLNSQEVFLAMPERDSAMVKLEKFQKELVEQLELVEVELNQKYAEYQKNYSTYNETVRAMKGKEMEDIQNRLQEMNTQAQQDLQTQQQLLLSPIIQKLNESIQKVGKANNFTAVFDSAGGAMLYFDESAMTDMAPMVKKELGIQ